VSIKVQSYVWEHSKAKGSALLLLLAIADHAHDDGDNAYPSVDTLKNKCRQSERNVQRLLRELAAMGEINIRDQKGPHGCNVYVIPVPWGGAKIAPLPNRAEKVPQMSPEPSLNTHTQEKSDEPTQPTPRENAWKELAEVFPMTNGVAWQKFDELWQKFPDPRRHTYAIERARKANPAKLQFYLEDFCSYDPDKPKTWGEGTRPAPSPRYSRNAAPAPNYRTRTD
jgi:hypothetical protein